MQCIRRLGALVALTLTASVAAGAQPSQAAAPTLGPVTLRFPTNDPVLERIWRLGMDSSHTRRLANVLLDSIGPRLTGSPGMKAASDWVISQYKAWGIEAKADRYGTWRGWRR